MIAAQQHYDDLLAGVYRWMLGDISAKRQQQLEFFQKHNISPKESKIALDMGAGNGVQAMPLAELGFSVKAVDFNKTLLEELSSEAKDLDIEIIGADISVIDSYKGLNPELIICMGDTLTHLSSEEEVERLLGIWYSELALDGKLILSFRELDKSPPDSRVFIPVRSDSSRIMTCLLDYYPGKVRVTDIIHEKSGDEWVLNTSSYYKLRLSTEQVISLCERAGFELNLSEEIQGMVYMILEKYID